MKCAVHSEADAVGYCRNCGKAMCSACVRPVRDVLYCEDCLAMIVGIPGAVPAGAPNPAASAPGILPPAPVPGRSTSSPGVAFVLGFFPGLGAVYNGEYNKALIHIVVFAAMIVGLSSDIGDAANTVLGLLLLLNNFNWFPFYRLGRLWPLILIGVGVLMFRNRLGSRP